MINTIDLTNEYSKSQLEEEWDKIEAKKDVIIKNIKMLYEVIGEKEPSIHPQWGSPHLFPWAYLPEEGVSKIIIGTIPPKKYCHGLCDEYYDNENTFFYESNHNSLWTYLNPNLKTKEEKRSYIKEHKIGFIDLIKQCTRKNNSSLDKDLIVDQDDIVNIDELVKVLKYAEEINVKNDIKEIKLCCTSHSFKSAHYFLKQIVKMNKDYMVINERKGILSINYKCFKKSYKIVDLPSPSGINHSSKRITEEEKRKIYQDELLLS